MGPKRDPRPSSRRQFTYCVETNRISIPLTVVGIFSRAFGKRRRDYCNNGSRRDLSGGIVYGAVDETGPKTLAAVRLATEWLGRLGFGRAGSEYVGMGKH